MTPLSYVNNKEQQNLNGNLYSPEDIFHLGAKVIIKNAEDKILILKCEKKDKSLTYWDLPGGRVQVGGTLEETALREVEEETGITTLKYLSFLGMVLQTFRITLADGEKVGLIYAFYSATVINTNIILSHEHQVYEWVTPQEAIERVGYMGATPYL